MTSSLRWEAVMLELLDQVDKYLVGDLSERALERWVAANLQSILGSGDEQAIELADAVNTGLVKLEEGLIDWAGFHRNLESLVLAARTYDHRFAEVALEAYDEAKSTDDLIVLETGHQFSPVTDLQPSHSFA